jgi:hypothetical protein
MPPPQFGTHERLSASRLAPRLALACAAIAITATLLLIGRGSDGRVRPVALTQITGVSYTVEATKAELNASAPGSPGHAVVRWFRAIQTGDHQALKRLTSPSELDRVGEGQLYQAAANIAAAIGRPLIESVRAYPGDVRAVRTLVLSYGDLGVTAAEAQTFNTTRSSGTWRVDDASYVIEASNALKPRDPR